MKWLLRILVWLIRIAIYGGLAFVIYVGYLNWTFYTDPNLGSSRNVIPQLFVTQDINSPMLKYLNDTGHYPTTAQGLTALIQAPDGVAGWHGPYLKIPPPQTHVIVRNGIPHRYTTTSISTNDLLTDPWRTPYHYRFPGLHNPTTYDLWSSGPDKLSGTPDDIGNW